MTRAPRALGLLALLIGGCDEDLGPSASLSQQFVVVRLAVDPATQIGEIFATQPALGDPFARGFDDISCDGDLASLALSVDVEVTDGVGFGDGALYFATRADDRDLCDGGGAVNIDPNSYDREGEPWVAGPMYVDGRTIDGRLPIGALPIPQLATLPRWWRFSSRMSRRAEDPDGGVPRIELEEAEVEAVWPASQIAERAVEDPAIGVDNLLDGFLGAGLQPDVDLDVDGLERFVDTDGDGAIDRCLDGDGSALDGPDCVRSPRIADGYVLRLRFRLQPVEVTAW